MQSTAVEEHLAAALESITDAEAEQEGEIEEAATQLATASTDAAADQKSGTMAATEQLARPSSPPGRRVRPAYLVAIAVVILAAVAGLAYYWSGGRDGRAEPDPGRAGTDGTGNRADTAPIDAPGTVSIASDPAGAEVWLDGEGTGQHTPAEIEIAAGKHGIELKLKGHVDWTHELDIAPGREVVLEPSLKPLPATVVVRTEPAGAQVEVDGNDRGAAPVTVEGLAPGKHAISARMPGRVDAEQELLAEPGGEHEIVLELKERTGGGAAAPKGKATLNITCLPWADVTLDGRPIGRTPIRGRTISAGKHKVVLTNPLKAVSRTHKFTIKPGETKLIRESF
jgi:hypothetical protein